MTRAGPDSRESQPGTFFRGALTLRKPAQYDGRHMKTQTANAASRKQDSHDRIVEVASRGLRRDGCDSLGVADVMKQAGLTHDGFYAHFASRDRLVAEAIEQAGRTSRAFMEEKVRSASAQ